MVESDHIPVDLEGSLSQLVVEEAIYKPHSLRYQIFDLGTLLFGEGVAAKVFKGEITNWFYEAQKDLRIYRPNDPEASPDRKPATFEEFGHQVQRFFGTCEYWAEQVGRAAFSGDKLHYYRVRCNNLFYETQQRVARGMGTPYGEITWENRCFVDELPYKFSNNDPEHARPRREVYGVTRID